MATETDAVNALLIARGLTPVNTLDSGHPDVVAARNILARRSEEVQTIDWWFNTENDVQLVRTPETWVRIPAGVLAIDDTTHVILNGYLYDIVNRSITFEEDPDPLTLIYERAWDQLASAPYNYILALAKEEFIRPLESSLLSGQAEKDVTRTTAVMQMLQLSHTDPSTLTNPLMQKWQTKMIQR